MEISDIDRFTNALKEAVQSPPGMVAYEVMMPEIRKRMQNLDITKVEGAKLSSVLILLYFHDGKVHLPLTKRHDYDGTHSGQISLPGGKHEDGDESREYTALRETREEIGVDSKDITLLGTLSEIYIPPSNFKVLPVLGFIEKKPNFVREEFEVKEIIEVELSDFTNKTNHKAKDIKVRDMTLKNTPYFDIQGHVVWGATAMILSELVYILDNLKFK